MNTDLANQPSSVESPSVMALFQQVVLPFFPQSTRESVERELPTLALLAYQLGVDVLVAEQQGLTYAEAVKRPEYLKMGRVYYGASNLLQWKLPAPVRKIVKAMLNHAVAGNFDPTRKVLFAIASRRNNPEAALCRFLLWVAVRLNLLILTWDDPAVELRGTLAAMEERAEEALRQLLHETQSGVRQDDVRPLHVLVAEMALRAYHHNDAVAKAMNDFRSELQEFLINADALEQVRSLDARSAAAFWPGVSEEELGSQQIADRYPQHFVSANAMEQHRSRLLKKIGSLNRMEDRLIDLIRSGTGDAS